MTDSIEHLRAATRRATEAAGRARRVAFEKNQELADAKHNLHFAQLIEACKTLGAEPTGQSITTDDLGRLVYTLEASMKIAEEELPHGVRLRLKRGRGPGGHTTVTAVLTKIGDT